MTIDSVNYLVTGHKPMDAPKAYIVCCAAYEIGLIHGTWVDLTSDINAIKAEIQAMLANSPIQDASAWMISGRCLNVGMCLMPEHASIEELHNLALFIQQHGDVGVSLFMYYRDLELAKTAMQDEYCGMYASELAFAMDEFQNFCAEAHVSEVHPYINYTTFFAQELKHKFLFFSIKGQLHVFNKEQAND